MGKLYFLLCGFFVLEVAIALNCFTQLEYEEKFKVAQKQYEDIQDLLLDSVDINGTTLDPSDPIYSHFRSVKLNWQVLSHHTFAVINNMALKSLKQMKNLTNEDFQSCLKNISTSDFCIPFQINCTPNSSYYRLDGQCNSASNPILGARFTPQIRLITPSYIDKINTLPSFRRLHSSRSDSIVGNKQKGGFISERAPLINNDYSLVAWQLFTHETMKTMKVQHTPHEHDAGFNCCNRNAGDPLVENVIKMNPHCRPIKVTDPADSCYAGKTDCLHYMSSLEAYQQCDIAQGQSAPINGHTAAIDFELLFNEKGLKHIEENNGTFNTKNHTIMKEILVGYDERSMQLPGLFLILSNFAEFYNKMFGEIIVLKPSLGVKGASFEARKIITALYQKLYVDLVKSVFPYLDPPTDCYNSNVNPQVSIEYNIALRFFHYFIRDSWAFYEAKIFLNQNGIRGNRFKEISQFDILDNLDLYINNKCGLTHGLLDSSWNTGSLGNITHCNFFAKSPTQRGIDLRSYDMEFADSVGEPSYCEVLKHFGSFTGNCDDEIRDEDFPFMDQEVLAELKVRFGNKIGNIGLTMGLDVENRNEAIGHTTEKIIAEQMDRFICGDKFWYNHENGMFTRTQRAIINQFAGFSFLCNVNKCNTTRIQQDIFFSAGSGNGKILCSDEFDLFDIKGWLGIR